MARIGYHASHEQFAPDALLRLARAAEAAGFAALSCSDHFHPWSERQGHSGHAWTWLGAALASTALPAGTVCCPFGRYHPAVIAQAAATLAMLFPGRFWLSLGSGEALNEHITGRPWPSKEMRNAALTASAEILRALWRGEEVSCDGPVRVDRARLYSRPERPPLLLGAALTEETARRTAEWADGLITVAAEHDTLRAVIGAFRERAGAGRPVYVQAKIAYSAHGDAAARALAFDQWRTNVFDSEIAADTETTAQFDALAARVRPEHLDAHVRISGDPGRHAAWLAADLDAGADVVLVHNVGTNQDEAIAAFAERVLPMLPT